LQLFLKLLWQKLWLKSSGFVFNEFENGCNTIPMHWQIHGGWRHELQPLWTIRDPQLRRTSDSTSLTFYRVSKQEAQLSQRDCAKLCVIEYFAKSIFSISLKLCLYVVPFMRYSTSKNGVTLKLGVEVVQGHWKWRRSIDHMRLSIDRPL